MIEYTIKEKKDNPRESVIELHGKPIEFTLYGMEASIAGAEKTIKELESTSKLNAAKMDNIERNHPFVKEMSEQDLFTAHMYQEAKAIVLVCNKKADEFKAAKAKDEAALVDLFEKMPDLKADVEAFEVEAKTKLEEVPSEEIAEEDKDGDVGVFGV